jgi:S-adenosylmethionine synthetase
VRITAACALVGRYIRDLDDYRSKKECVRALVKEAAMQIASIAVEVEVNAADGDALTAFI